MDAFVPKGARVAVLTGPPGDATSDARIEDFDNPLTSVLEQ